MSTGADRSWARGAVATSVREVLLTRVLAPLMRPYARRRFHGHEHLDGLAGPVLFVATHASHMDTPLILQALPRGWRRRTAVAAASDYFYRLPWLANVVSLAFNTVPVRRRSAGDGANAVSDLSRLLDERWSIVVFAEGTRSRDGSVGRLHAGAAVLAAAHGVPLVPVHISGTRAVMPVGRRWMRRGPGGRRQPVEVCFGPAVHMREGEHRREAMERVREFFEACGAATTPDERFAARRVEAR